MSSFRDFLCVPLLDCTCVNRLSDRDVPDHHGHLLAIRTSVGAPKSSLVHRSALSSDRRRPESTLIVRGKADGRACTRRRARRRTGRDAAVHLSRARRSGARADGDLLSQEAARRSAPSPRPSLDSIKVKALARTGASHAARTGLSREPETAGSRFNGDRLAARTRRARSAETGERVRLDGRPRPSPGLAERWTTVDDVKVFYREST